MEKIISFFVRDKLVVNLIVIVIVIAGFFSIKNLQREIFPNTEMDRMSVRITYPGASAEDVELNAVIPVEDAISNIPGISDYTSTIRDGNANISIELDEDLKDVQSVKDEIYRTVSLSNISGISTDVTKLTVTEFSPAMMSVFRFALKPLKEDTPRSELFEMSSVLEDLLKKVDGVSSVTRSGTLEREIHINVDPKKLDEEYISISEIISSIKLRNVRASSGTLQSIERDKNILTVGEFQNPIEVGDVIVRSGFEQGVIRVKDLAKIEDTFESSDTKIRANGAETVIFNVRKKETADIIKTVDALNKFLKDNSDVYNKKFEIDILEDNADSIRSLLSVVIGNAFLGFALVLLILFIFLDFKTSFWTAFSIPICISISAVFMSIMDISLNIITLGALITIIGMLVDDGIVIAEVIYVKKEAGIHPVQAAISGVKEVINPVSITIFSTIVAFLPMLFVTGRMGKFIYVYPLIVSIALLSSLFEAVTILPNHLAYAKTKKIEEKKWYMNLRERYKRFLLKCINMRYMVLAFFVILLMFSLWLGFKDMKRFSMYNSSTTEQLVVTLKVTEGSTLAQTEKYVKILEKNVIDSIKKDDLVSVISTIGAHTTSRTDDNFENWATMEIRLTPATRRETSTKEVVASLNKILDKQNYDFLKDIVVSERRWGPSAGSAVDIRVITDNEQNSIAVMELVKKTLEEIPQVNDISSDLARGKDELRIKFDYIKLAQYGLDVSTVASTVRAAFEGVNATYVQTSETKLQFRVQVEDRYLKDEKYLMSQLIPNKSGKLVKLSEIAYLTTEKGPVSIRHYNGERSISVTAGLKDRTMTSQQVNKLLQKKLKDVPVMYPGTYLMYGGEFNQTNTALKDLGVAFLAALLLIYLIVLLLFRSVGQPLVILSVIPFGLIGVLLALKAHGLQLDFMGIIGIIGLSGVVVNDSIIMVDFINKERKMLVKSKKQISVISKIAEGAAFRLRPIILTTVTTVGGLLPTIYLSGDVNTFQTTVIAMAYGLMFGTLLTLIFVPSLYMIALDVKTAVLKVLSSVNLPSFLKNKIITELKNNN
ncbi:MAG: efflux RND transporter permease subunit [Spirochaetes bacterium]|nr:efflux RND transporter permease subunit [Spirochaetota bacterium]